MNKSILQYFMIVIVMMFSLIVNVKASTENVVEMNDRLYGYALDNLSLTLKNYEELNDHFMRYINENLDPSKTYLALFKLNEFYLVKTPVDYSQSPIFKKSDSSFYSFGSSVSVAKCSYSKEGDSLKFTDFKSYSAGNPINSIYDTFTSSEGALIWSNKLLKYEGEELENYYSYQFNNIPEELTKYYRFDKLSPYTPIYTYTNLLFGTYVEEEKEKVGYRIEYYFDDLIDNTKTEYLFGYVGDKVDSYTDNSSDLYKLYTDNQNYVLDLTDNETNNVLRVYYRSPLYGTEKTPIDTNVKEFYFFYNFNDIKSMFPSIKYENFTQFEQFLTVITFNIFYCLFLFFIIYISLKMLYKGWTWIMSFIL